MAWVRALAGSALLCLTAVACGTGASPLAAEQELPAAQSVEGAFPVTTEHKFGSTEIPEAPERVVSVGLTDQDSILALGVTPVGVLDWFGDQPHAVWPWAQYELGDAEPVIVGLGTELDYERIASVRPDLIVGVYSGLTKEQYAEVEEGFVEAREAHPEFQGRTALVATPAGSGIYGVYGADESAGRFLTSLGFQWPKEVTELVGDGVQADISREQFELLDTDVLVWLLNAPAERKALANDPLYQQLGVASQGREVFLEYEPFGGAIFFSSVLSLPFLLDGLVPQLAAAADGDPTTAADQV